MKEFYPGNRFYGHGNIIRKYSGFPHWLPLPVCIQHGWTVKVSSHDARIDAPENWYWSFDIAKKTKEEYPYIKYRVIGSPFLYCLRNMHHKNIDYKLRNGTIVFPFHSTELISLDSNLDEYCYLLHQLPDEYKPISICVYHSDKKKGFDLFFIEKGFDVICNGDDPCNDDFLCNFIKNTRDKKFLISNEWSTAIHYGAIIGCRVHLYGPKVNVLKSDDKNFSENFRNLYSSFEIENRKIYSIKNEDVERQFVVANKELGMRYLVSRVRMFLLLWNLVLSKEYFNNLFHN